MQVKSHISKRLISIILTLVILVSGITLSPDKAYAAGWLEYAQETITLGTSVSGSIKDGDYYGLTEAISNSSARNVYWHIYKFAMPKDGLLNLYIESASSKYLTYGTWRSPDEYNGFVIYSTSDPDTIMWRSKCDRNEIEKQFSSSRAMYYGSTEIALNQGEYYFAIRQHKTLDEPYYLTLSYQEPIINVSSISLSPSSLTMKVGDQRTIVPTVLPNNATDKTVIWQSSNPSIATVEDGTVRALSVGSTTITASSSDGEITASCPVIIRCEHNYQTSITPAGMEKEGYITKTCSKCGEETETTIPGIENIELSQTAYDYDGKTHQPDVTVTDEEGDTLEAGKDYTVSYSGNTINIGTHTVTVNFIGNYEGTQTRTFTVSPIYTDSISLSPSRLTINIGSQQEITATILPDNATDKTIIWKSSNPSVATVENGLIKAVSVGRATITATTVDSGEIDECIVSVTCPHSYHTALTPASKTNNGSLKEECTKCGDIRQNVTIYAISDISLSKVSYTYTGKVCSPAVTVKDCTGRTLEKNEDYTIAYNGNRKNVGVYNVVVTFKGNYAGTEIKQFTIYPKSTKLSSVKPKRKGFLASWKKQSAQISGYELAYSTNSKFKEHKVGVVSINKNKTKKTIGKLGKRTKYYIRIRTYKNVSLNGKTTKLYSSWSKPKKVTTK